MELFLYLINTILSDIYHILSSIRVLNTKYNYQYCKTLCIQDCMKYQIIHYIQNLNFMRFVQILAILCLLGVPCTVALNIYHKEGVPQSSHDQAQGLHTQFSNLKDGSRFQTIVIGGGIAGVAAAVQLAKSGQHVAILEGKKYLGGRLKTTPIRLFDGGTLQFDEGASWIHGSSE